MSVFVKIKIKPKNTPPQVNAEREIMVSSDAILTYRKRRDNEYDISIKPEYWPTVAKAMSIDLRLDLEYAIITGAEVKVLSELGKA
jgi:hypothetical protein